MKDDGIGLKKQIIVLGVPTVVSARHLGGGSASASGNTDQIALKSAAISDATAATAVYERAQQPIDRRGRWHGAGLPV